VVSEHRPYRPSQMK